ncbi:DUF1508 domain-containing protein [Apibacter sp. wkB309]|uniref:YegP family protein n=1 Tax=Apibacter sp. wkB309 TaxID=1679467 RepID=UPI000CF89001|nr:DUF1508 domain-containing protein [Apibacter sp. wkB309]PQL89819.1 hypothetical protein C4S75_07460 [Apibacter sp. wkB309]
MIHSNNKEIFYFKITKDYNNLFFFCLKNEKGNICLGSLPYTRKTDCQEGIKSVICNFKNGERFGVKRSPYGRYDVYLKAVNGEIIAVSADFYTKEEAINLIKNFKNLSLKTPVVDKTE